MDKTFQSMIVAAIRQAKGRTSLLWAERLADRIADSTPLEVNRAEIGERLTREAIRQGIPVVVAPSGFKFNTTGLSEAGRQHGAAVS